MNQTDDRRRAPRVDLVGQLHGQLVSLDVAIRVREVSLGGMSIETARPFEIGRRLVFMLTLGDGAGVQVPGKVVYSRPAEGPSGPAFISGVQFLDEDADEGPGPVDEIVDRLK